MLDALFKVCHALLMTHVIKMQLDPRPLFILVLEKTHLAVEVAVLILKRREMFLLSQTQNCHIVVHRSCGGLLVKKTTTRGVALNF